MNSIEIYDALKNVPNFVGVFSCDNIPYIPFGKLVINTQPMNLPGQHWIAILITHFKIIYFDPLNLPINHFIHNYIISCNKTIVNLNFASQNIYSSTCGLHVIYFIQHDYVKYNDYF